MLSQSVNARHLIVKDEPKTIFTHTHTCEITHGGTHTHLWNYPRRRNPNSQA